jgi:hypothetical protein
MQKPSARVLWALCLVGCMACEDEDAAATQGATRTQDSGAQDAAASADAGEKSDAGAKRDAGATADAGATLDEDAGATTDAGSGAGGPKYVLASVVFGVENERTSYLNVIDSLDAQKLDYRNAVELTGWADLWVHEGKVFVANDEQKEITKYAVSEAGELVEEGRIGFANYGIEVAFWSNTFVAKDKVYALEGVNKYVVWNPETLEITGEIELPELPERAGFIQRAGTLDRANVIRDGLLYTPMYWSDEDYLRFTPDSRVIVTEIATNKVLRTLEAPCAGLDIGSADDQGNIFFSTWTSGVFQPLLGETESNCVAKIARGVDDAVTTAFTFKEVAEGREGAAVRNFRDGKLFMSIFHDERVDFDAPGSDPSMLLGEKNWRTWVYDPASEKAAVVDGLDWNAGATYVVRIADTHYMLVPGTDYASTTVVAIDKDLKTSERFELRGWGTRLFQVR